MPTDDVACYYDRNTRRFLLVGSGRGRHNLHRELWAPGVGSASEAAGHINKVIGDHIAEIELGAEVGILDFGCGVGGTLFHLAERFPTARLGGITVSRRQVEIGERLATKLGYSDRCTFSLGDFQVADLGLRADVIVAVESFVHSDDAGAFLANAARHLRSGGRLIIADDFLALGKDSLDARQRAWVDHFIAGWRVPSVCTTSSLVAEAENHGLTAERVDDLTSLTRPGSRPRDRLTAVVSPLLARLGLGRIPFCGNLIGGNALQVGLREGFIRYRLVVLRRVP